MTEAKKKREIKKLVKFMLKQSHEEAVKKIDKAINSGALNIEDWSAENSPMVLPKTITLAILEDEARQYEGRGTNVQKTVRKEANNLKYFL